MTLMTKLMCTVLGHRLVPNERANVASGARCSRKGCPHEEPRVEWPHVPLDDRLELKRMELASWQSSAHPYPTEQEER